MARSILIFAFIMLLSYVAGIYVLPESSVTPIQPIAFNHSAHLKKGVRCAECHFICEKNRDEDGDLDCDDCEESAHIFCEDHQVCQDHKLPGVPGAKVCLSCHDSDLEELADKSIADASKDPKYVMLQYYQKNEDEEFEVKQEIPWQRVTKITTSNVFFSHRAHAILAKIDCVICHGDVDKWESPPEEPFVKIRMQWCLGCHEHTAEVTKEWERPQAPSTDCVSCHR